VQLLHAAGTQANEFRDSMVVGKTNQQHLKGGEEDSRLGYSQAFRCI